MDSSSEVLGHSLHVAEHMRLLKLVLDVEVVKVLLYSEHVEYTVFRFTHHLQGQRQFKCSRQLGLSLET